MFSMYVFDQKIPAFMQHSLNKSIDQAIKNAGRNVQLTTPKRRKGPSPKKLTRSARKINIDLGNNKVDFWFMFVFDAFDRNEV